MHLEPDELLQAAHGIRSARTSDHLDECASCLEAVSRLRLEAAMAERLTWAAVGAGPIEPGALLDELPVSEDEGRVLEHLRMAHDALFADPRHALDLARLAEREARVQPAESGGDHLLVLALRERANALFRLGRFEEAEHVLDEAGAIAVRLPVGEYECAVLDYIRAGIDVERGRFRTAVDRATAAGHTLDLFGDSERALNARVLGAVAHFESGNYEAALDVLNQMLVIGGSGLSGILRATLHQNRGGCLAALSRFAEADEDLLAAETFFEQEGMRVEVTRVIWTRGLAAARAGHPADGARKLANVAAAFDELGMESEAAAARLDLLSPLARLGRRDDVARLASRIAPVFSRTESRSRLADALAILRDAASHDPGEVLRAVVVVRQEELAKHPLGRIASIVS